MECVFIKLSQGGGGFRRGGGNRRPAKKALLVSKEQVAMIEVLYKTISFCDFCTDIFSSMFASFFPLLEVPLGSCSEGQNQLVSLGFLFKFTCA